METCPNPLFVEWLMEWRDAATAKGNKSQHTYERAIRSLRKYPLVLPTGKDCRILANFGEKICQMLDDRLLQHRADFGLSADDDLTNDLHWTDHLTTSPNKPGRTQKSKKESPKKGRVYIPQPQSGPYAILITLLNDSKKASSCGYMSKVQLMKDAQPLSEKSFKHPDPGCRYTAWSSIGTLIKKGLLEKTSSPARYHLTEAGCSLAELLLATDDNATNIDIATTSSHIPDNSGLSFPGDLGVDVTCGNLTRDVQMVDVPLQDRLKLPWQNSEPQKHATVTTTTSKKKTTKPRNPANTHPHKPANHPKPSHTMTAIRETPRSLTIDTDDRAAKLCTITSSGTDDGVWVEEGSSWQLDAYSYDIILCVDNQELHGAGASREFLLTELRKNKVAFDVRKLQVGDFLWVARDNTGKAGSVELVLDYIVERKRMDDLAGSIIDGRFSEQKYRLSVSNITHVIYLIESYGSSQHFSIPEDTLMQAITNTQIIDGFFVKQTGNANESAAYLTLMTRYLQSHYAGKPLLHAPNEKGKNCGENPKLGTFEEFSVASVKTKATTVCEMMCKQLLQMHGMTAEKVTAITDVYSTPIALYTAYQGCQTEIDRENLLANLKAGTLQRSVGKCLSKAVSMLYCPK